MQKNILSRLIVPALFGLMLVVGAPMALANQSDQMSKENAMAVDNTDGGITTLVKNQLNAYPNVNVSTDSGVVTISGAVDNKVQRDTVIDMVGKRGDVKGVVDKLTIRNP